MARLCVRVGSNASTRSQPGDVISVEEDGHVWSKAELNCGQYQFIDTPGVDPSALINLVTPVLNPQDGTRNLSAQKLDISQLSSVKGRSITKAEIDAITVVKV